MQGDLDKTTKQVITNSSIRGIVRGGSQSACGSIATANKGSAQIRQFERCLREGGTNYQDAVPIAYSLRHLKDNTLARVVFPISTALVRNCLQTGATDIQKYQITRVRSSNNDTNIFNRALEVTGEIHIQPVAASRLVDVGPGDSCSAYRSNPGGIQLVSSTSSTQRILRFPYTEQYNGNWHNIINRNFRVVLPRMTNQNLLIICGEFVEHQGRGRRNFSQRQIISTTNAQLELGNGIDLRFGQGRFHMEVSLLRLQ